MSEIDPQDLEIAWRLWGAVREATTTSDHISAREAIAQALTSARQSGFRMGVEKAAEVVEHEMLSRALYIDEHSGLEIALEAIRSLSPTPETQG